MKSKCWMPFPIESKWLAVFALLSLLIGNLPAVSQEIAEPGPASTASQGSNPDSPESPVDSQPRLKNFWVFLKSGQPSTKFERDEIEKMQAAHLENFGRLFKLGKLSAAGPLSDPAKTLRGIVCVSATDAADVPAYFAEDPFIEHGLLEIEAHEIIDQQGAFSSKFSETEMEEFQIVVLQSTIPAPGEITSEMEESTRDHLTSILQPEQMRLALRFESNENNVVGILILKKQEPASTEALINKIPLISGGHWKHQMLPLYMSQGILNDNSE